MKPLSELIKVYQETGLSMSDLARMTGLSLPTIRLFLKGGDLRVSTLEKIDAVLNPTDDGVNSIRDVNGNSNVITQTQSSPSKSSPRIVMLSNAEKMELVELRVKVDYQSQIIAEKNELISQLKERIAELTSKDVNGTKAIE